MAAPGPDLRQSAVELLARHGGSGTFRVRNGDRSMLPQLRGGRRFLVRFEPGLTRPRRGDLVLYSQQDYHVVHRLLGPAVRGAPGPRFRTRGDGNLGLDPVLTPERIEGVVSAIETADSWRSLEGGGARLWAVAVAWHDLFWAANGVAAAWVDVRIGRRGRVRPAVAAIDRGLLAVAHALLFRLLHRRVEAPTSAAD